jgi:NADH:ubiquinone oxidoreductase subunit E
MSKFSIPDVVLFVCTGSKCSKRGGKDMYKSAKAFAKYHTGDKEFEVILTECTDRCKFAPVCSIQPRNIWLKEYTEKDVLKLLQKQMEHPGE